MIASAIQQFGWTKPPAGPENTAPGTVAPKAPTAASLDPAQVQQMAQSLAAVRETVQELAAGQDQMKREIVKMESALVEHTCEDPRASAAAPRSPCAQARAGAAAIVTGADGTCSPINSARRSWIKPDKRAR
jgi:hypothetical protein